METGKKRTHHHPALLALYTFEIGQSILIVQGRHGSDNEEISKKPCTAWQNCSATAKNRWYNLKNEKRVKKKMLVNLFPFFFFFLNSKSESRKKTCLKCLSTYFHLELRSQLNHACLLRPQHSLYLYPVSILNVSASFFFETPKKKPLFKLLLNLFPSLINKPAKLRALSAALMPTLALSCWVGAVRY